MNTRRRINNRKTVISCFSLTMMN